MTNAPQESATDEEDEQGDEQHGDRDAEKRDEQVDAHLQNIDDGAGCTEIWEHLSENRGTDA